MTTDLKVRAGISGCSTGCVAVVVGDGQGVIAGFDLGFRLSSAFSSAWLEWEMTEARQGMDPNPSQSQLMLDQLCQGANNYLVLDVVSAGDMVSEG